MLTYLELIDSRGCVNTKSVPVKEDDLLLLSAIASVDPDGDEDTEELYDLLDEADELETIMDETYAFNSFISGDHLDTANARSRYWKKVFKALDEKGFYASMWEEGSYAICRDGFKQKAVDAIARIEARVSAENWNF
jgi:hypothetical protein